MPELPEVEVQVRLLRRWLGGRQVRLEDLDLGCGERSMRVTGVRRRAKYALVEGDEVWALHLRMTGKVVPSRGGRARARFHTDEGVYDFEDSRRFGTLTAGPRFDDAHLGPEPWPDRRDGAWWRARLGDRRAPVKTALMRQDLVAGLGNIAACEILFRARISPFTAARDVHRWDALAEAAHAYLTEVVETEGGGEILYVNQGGPNPFSVYQQERCPACAGPLQRTPQAGRTTWSCPSCQPP